MVDPKEWREFPRAREFARSLELLDQGEWYAYARGDLRTLKGLRPDDIPFNPMREYRHEGWTGVRDWLGPPPLAPLEPGYLEFRRARRFAQSLELASSEEWRRWCAGLLSDRPRRPANVPEDPMAMYPAAWRGWDEWLGGHRPPRRCKYLPFEEAREFARGLQLADVKEWRAFCRGDRTDLGARPGDVPACPDNVYRHSGWIGYGDWLGTDSVSVLCAPYLPFEEAREFARGLGLASGDEWRVWTRGDRPDLPARPRTVPSNPQRTYARRGWTDWGDFLGTGNTWKGDFRPFPEARCFARRLGLKGTHEWREYCRGERRDLGRRPADVPADPNCTYAGNGWTDWGDYLGTGRIATGKRRYRSFAAARRFARALRLEGVAEWRAYLKGARPDLPPLPPDIPTALEYMYAEEGWRGWPDFLGSGRDWVPFEEARDFARRSGIRSFEHWISWRRGECPDLPALPRGHPRSPAAVYRGKGWKGWRNYLGTERKAPAPPEPGPPETSPPKPGPPEPRPAEPRPDA